MPEDGEAIETRGSAPDMGDGPIRIALEEKLDLAAACALHEALADIRGRPVVLRADAVRHLSAAGLQVLIAARRSWAAEGTPLSLEAPSDGFSEGLRRLGASIELLEVSPSC